MDETKYVCVPVELSNGMLEAWERRGIERVKLAMAGVESITPYRTSIKETYAVAIAAAPQSHVAVPRELLECVCHALEMEGATTFGWEGEDENFNDLAAELRTLLAKE